MTDRATVGSPPRQTDAPASPTPASLAAFFTTEMPPDEWAEYMVKAYNELADRVEVYVNALRLVDAMLTTVTGDNVPRGEACKLQARSAARAALDYSPESPSGTEAT